MDEASQIDRAAFDIIIACLREGGEQGWLSATFTPRGKLHWTFEVFGRSGPNCELFHATSADNPFLPPDFVETIRRQYTSAQAAQELGGAFTDVEGSLFRRDWLGIVEYAPKVVRAVRAWDMASTEQKDGNDPDWTAGVLIGRLPNYTYVILDVVRTRATPSAVEELMKRTAERDGRNVEIVVEEEPGSAGKWAVSHLLRNIFAGWPFYGQKSTGPKATRAQPLAAMAERGEVKLLRGEWNKTFLDELEVFPLGGHDDQVDAASLAFSKVAQKGVSAPEPAMLQEIQAAREAEHKKRLDQESRMVMRGRATGAGARWLRAMSGDADTDGGADAGDVGFGLGGWQRR
jgi:predicted phage terminase large subunit-like protein